MDLKSKPRMENSDNLQEVLQRGKLKSEQISELKNLFQAALADGRLTSREMAQIQFFYYDSELSETEFTMLKGSVFQDVVKTAINDHNISGDEKASILRIANQLGVSPEWRGWADEIIEKYSQTNKSSAQETN